jgi:Flp pilus assembly protein TadD/TolB-like protein
VVDEARPSGRQVYNRFVVSPSGGTAPYAASAAVSAGDRIGPFDVLGPLGAGGMGELYRARDPRLGREIAIKLLSSRLGESREHRQRFQQEALAASALNHPNIVTIHEIGVHEGRPYIAMELVEGRTLRAVAEEGFPTLRRLVAIAAQLANGMAAAHERGIVHRDLKPENVMVTAQHHVKILDFGLAKLAPGALQSEGATLDPEIATRSGHLLGTIGYMSPEQARGKELDHRSDQFAFGSLLYELLAGERAFRGDSPVDTLSAILHHDPEPLTTHQPQLPDALVRVVARCLAKDPADRWVSTYDLAQELEAIRDHLTDHSLLTRALPAPRRLGRRHLVAVLAVTGALVAAGFLFVRGERPPDGVEGRRVAGSAVATARHVAVLPFRDLSGTASGALVGAGFAETVSARLSESGLAVLPELGSGGAEEDVRELALRLGVAAVLRGSLQFQGERVRATFTVLEADGRQLAGGTVEGATARLLELQDEVARRAAVALGVASPPAVAASPLGAGSQDRFLEALGHLRRYENEASVDAAVRILEELGDSAPVASARARAYLAKYTITRDRSWAERAIAAADRAATLDPADLGVRETRGEIDLLLGRAAEARAAFERAVAARPGSVSALLGLGRALAALGDRAGAERRYRDAIALQPGWWATHSHLGAFLLREGRFDEATSSYREAVRLSPDNTRAIGNLAIAYQQAGRYDEAIAEYERAIAIMPTAATLSNLGTCEFFSGRYARAAAAYRRALALQPERAVLWLNLGDALRWSGHAGEARAAYAAAVRGFEADLALTPRDAEAQTNLALALARSGDAEAAKHHAGLARELAPGDPYTTYQVGLVRLAGGDTAGAAELVAAALAAGYSRAEAARDPELVALKNDPRWGERLARQLH